VGFPFGTIALALEHLSILEIKDSSSCNAPTNVLTSGIGKHKHCETLMHILFVESMTQLIWQLSGLQHRAWRSLKDCSTCQAVVILYKSSCVMHMGAARAGHKPEDALLGPICRRAMSSEQGNYLANLALYPGRCIGSC